MGLFKKEIPSTLGVEGMITITEVTALGAAASVIIREAAPYVKPLLDKVSEQYIEKLLTYDRSK